MVLVHCCCHLTNLTKKNIKKPTLRVVPMLPDWIWTVSMVPRPNILNPTAFNMSSPCPRQWWWIPMDSLEQIRFLLLDSHGLCLTSGHQVGDHRPPSPFWAGPRHAHGGVVNDIDAGGTAHSLRNLEPNVILTAPNYGKETWHNSYSAYGTKN